MAIFIPDANVLISLITAETASHEKCMTWFQKLDAQDGVLALCELTEVAFLRALTLPKIGKLNVEDALLFWQKSLWGYPFVQRLSPTEGHNDIFAELLKKLKLRGNDVNDAWLAALAIEHRATLVSLDKGFARFRRLSWINPEDD